VDRDDPEKRIADLERQLAEQRAASDPGANWGLGHYFDTYWTRAFYACGRCQPAVSSI
jgi:hypothetical protein